MTLASEFALAGPRSLRGRVRVPGDKGISHRALLLAALAEGPCRIGGLAEGDDVARTGSVVAQLGVKVRREPSSVTVYGSGGRLHEPEDVCACGNSATTMRMVAGVVAAQRFHTVLTGDASLSRRPMARVVEPLRNMGARIDGRDGGTHAPLAIRGGGLRGTRCELEISSGQVKSAVLLAGLRSAGVTEVVEPAPSRDHTERMLGALGVPVERPEPGTVRVSAASVPAFEVEVPGDPSSAAFFAVAASVTPGSRIVLEGIDLNPTRLGFVDVLTRMGGRLDVLPAGERLGEPVGDLVVEAAPLSATTIVPDEGMIDEIPALAVAAAFAEGVTEISDAAELRVKESDRIGTLQQELSQMGVVVEARADGLTIHGGHPHATQLKSHGDHRIAMALAVAANATGGMSTVRGWNVVGVSYPGFARDLAALTGGGGG